MRTLPMRNQRTMKTQVLGIVTVMAMALLTSGCPSTVQADCQTLPSAQGGYVLHLIRSGAAAAGCDTQTPAEMSDIWVFDTLFDSQIRAHSVSMPFPNVDTLPTNLIGSGKFTTREADSNNRCFVTSLTTMSDTSTGTLLSYSASNMEWLGRSREHRAGLHAGRRRTVRACAGLRTGDAPPPR